MLVRLSAWSRSELRRLRDKIDSLRGDGVTNTRDRIVISQRQSAAALQHFAAPVQIVIVKIGSALPGGGKYRGYLTRGVVETLSTSTALSNSEIAEATQTEITIINPQETGKSTHALTASPVICSFFPAIPLGRLDDEGKPVYAVWGIDLKECT